MSIRFKLVTIRSEISDANYVSLGARARRVSRNKLRVAFEPCRDRLNCYEQNQQRSDNEKRHDVLEFLTNTRGIGTIQATGGRLELEYTDAPPREIAPNETETVSCPRCGTTLPKDAQKCDRCGWAQGEPSEGAEGKASDLVAMLLSVVPGLGHIYKGHRLVGILLILGAPLAVGFSALAATATAGFGLGLMVFYWFAAGFHAYAISDRVAPGMKDEGEQY